MKRIFSLLLSLAFPLMLLVNTANAIPPNAHVAGSGWNCNTGYKRQGQQCNKIFVPPNAVLRGQGWICKSGFKRRGNQCNRVAQANRAKSRVVAATAKRSATPKTKPQMSVVALYNAVVLYNNEDFAGALRLFTPLANQGNAKAQFYMGAMYSSGYGVLTDKKRAAFWYQKAANRGHKSAQSNLGSLYSSGEGVLKDEKKAFYWYKKSADQGDAIAQSILGLSYYLGKGVLRDDKKAVYWHRKAAIQGERIGQGYLGKAYCTGRGVLKDLHKCAIWTKKSFENGYTDARKTWDEFELWKHQ